METERIQEVNDTAKYINSIIGSQMAVRMSWGFIDPAAILYNDMPALQFHVAGFQHQGNVVVALNEGADLFDIFLLKRNGKIKKHIDGVYFDELLSVLDRNIETGNMSADQYQEKVNNAVYSI
ncbi:MAG: hypothetical protein PHH23_01685 [Paludibacteraceae bacterium]|nr:hypothetical protein [Paludibacteraceae bacterium]